MKIIDDAFIINKAELRALIKFACKDDARPSINGIRLDGPKGAIVATDGHRLLKIAALQTTEIDGTLDLSLAKRICAAATSKSEIRFTSLGWSVDNFDSAYDLSDCPFPSYNQVIPSDQSLKKIDRIGVTLPYLADLALVASATDSKTGIGRLTFYGELDPIVVNIGGYDGCELTAVVMPARL